MTKKEPLSPPSSPKYLISTPLRAGKGETKWGESEKGLHSIFAISDLSLDSGYEETKDRSVKFVFTGRPKIKDEDGKEKKNQGRHIHAFSLYEEAIYSALEKTSVLSVPEILYDFLKKHAHFYCVDRSYDDIIEDFFFKTFSEVDAPVDNGKEYREKTSKDQRKEAEALDERVNNYFQRKSNEIARKYKALFDDGYVNYEKLFELEGELSKDEIEVVSISFDLLHRQDYLTSRDIRANMKDASYIEICSKMNALVSEAIEIVNAMPGITFEYGSAKGNAEAHALRWLREENEKQKKDQDPEVVAKNMNVLIDFPVSFFMSNTNYNVNRVLKNHICLIEEAFPNIKIDANIIKEFIDYFRKTIDIIRATVSGKKPDSGKKLDELSWDSFNAPEPNFNEVFKLLNEDERKASGKLSPTSAARLLSGKTAHSTQFL